MRSYGGELVVQHYSKIPDSREKDKTGEDGNKLPSLSNQLPSQMNCIYILEFLPSFACEVERSLQISCRLVL